MLKLVIKIQRKQDGGIMMIRCSVKAETVIQSLYLSEISCREIHGNTVDIRELK